MCRHVIGRICNPFHQTYKHYYLRTRASEHTGGWPEHECFTLFRLTSNQIRSLSCTVSSRVSDDSGFGLSKTFITASNTWG